MTEKQSSAECRGSCTEALWFSIFLMNGEAWALNSGEMFEARVVCVRAAKFIVLIFHPWSAQFSFSIPHSSTDTSWMSGAIISMFNSTMNIDFASDFSSTFSAWAFEQTLLLVYLFLFAASAIWICAVNQSVIKNEENDWKLIRYSVFIKRSFVLVAIHAI